MPENITTSAPEVSARYQNTLIHDHPEDTLYAISAVLKATLAKLQSLESSEPDDEGHAIMLISVINALEYLSVSMRET